MGQNTIKITLLQTQTIALD